MSTRKVVDAKNLDTDELVYFKSHAKATYMSDGTTVEDAIKTAGTESLTVTVTGVTEGFTIRVYDGDGNVIDSQTTPTKTYRIKEGVSYSVVASAIEGYKTPESTDLKLAYPYVDTSVEMKYEQLKITTIRLNMNLTDPYGMITRIVNLGGIEAIRENSHRYTGTVVDHVMQLKQLDDNDGTKYLDGTDAILITLGNDVWMKLPKFYWSVSNYEPDVFDISVAYGVKPDNSYNTWEGNDLIGVYEAYRSSSKIYSTSDVFSTTNTSQSTFKSYASARGDGFSLVKWKHHCMMGVLYYIYYGNTNCQEVVGSGTSSDSKPTGETNSLGMKDTDTTNGNSMSINFWGLENWWGNKYEWIDNVVNNSGVFTITEDDGTTREVNSIYSNGYITKMLIYPNLDLAPTAASGSSTTGFCDYYYYGTTNTVLARSCKYADDRGGVAFLYACDSASDAYAYVGSRLAYTGEYEIIG